MTIKFRWVDTVSGFTPLQYYVGKSKSAKIEIKKSKNNIYSFFIDREKDGFIFNSAWGKHPNELYQRLLDELPVLRFDKDDEALEFVDNWVQKNVPKYDPEIKYY